MNYTTKINKKEIIKFFSMSFMMIMIIFIYSVQRVAKDTTIITILDADLISTVKLLGVFPSAVMFMLFYTKLCDLFKKTTIFHLFNFIFISYFLYFTVILNTNIEKYTTNLRILKNIYPILYNPLIIIEHWFYSIYYINSELWGSVMLALIFWQISNQVFSINQAKKFYPLLGFFGQLGMLISDAIVKLASSTEISKNWQESLTVINFFVLSSGLMLSIVFFILSNFIIPNGQLNISNRKKNKGSFIQNLVYIANSKYLLLIASTIMCYGISINLIEGPWKAQVKILYPDQQSYASFMGKLQGYTGRASMIMMILGSLILRLLSWKSAAILTPAIIFCTGSIFYIFSIFQNSFNKLMAISPVLISVMAGFIQNVVTKSTKYVFFDSTKEISYIPLNNTLKTKGKAASDIIGGRLGKSGGAAIQFFLLLIPGSNLINLSPILFVIFLFVMIAWFIVVNMLSIEFKKASSIK